MRCPACQAENREGRKFCVRCGSALAAVCPACGAGFEPGDGFCGECGTPLGGGAPASAATLPPPVEEAVAERRLVSVLFADLVGFTAASEERDAEETRELLSRYFELARTLIGRYGGTVEKFIGDAVMAVWGTPVATEDDAERAVRAALDLVTSVPELDAALQARAGVLTGEAAVTVGAVGEGMVAGDLVNTASRVQSVAEPGTVLVSDATRRASERAVVYERAGGHALRGRAETVTLFRALRVVSGVGGQMRSEGLEAPFVGRERELRLLKEHFHACAQERRAQLLSVTGIAGIGKSRLAWEFYKYVDGLADSVWWHRGRCLAYGEGVTYWALADMLRMRCRIAEDEAPESARERLRAALDEHLLDTEERRFVEPRLAQLLGLEEGIAERQDLFAAWRVFFERLSDSSPVVLVFEDLQWADAALLDFIEYLLEWSRAQPIFVLTLARPELLERRPSWGAGQRSFSSLFLEPLSEEAMDTLLTGLVPGLTEAVRAQILARAEGVPLYAVETVRMLLDRGALVYEGSVYRVVGELERLDVPETLQALIAARLDGLGAGERRLVQDAAVLGKTFTLQALATLSGVPGPEVEAALAGLVRKELLSIQADPRSPERGQYSFLQDLVRRVAYETLSKRERRARHLAAAEQVASSLGEDEAAEIIASHLLSAYEAAVDPADAEAAKARVGGALVRAGERARSLAAAAEAQRYFEQAAALTDDPLARAELDDRAGQMAWQAGKSAEARSLLERAHEAYTGRGEARAAARVSARLAEIDFSAGHATQAVDRLAPAVEALESGEPDADLSVVTAQLGRFLIFAGDLDRATRYLDRALALAEAFQAPETLVQALNSKAVIALRRSHLHEARILLQGALELALAHDLHAAALRVYNNLGMALDSSEVARADLAGHGERALELARRAGERNWEATFLGGLVGVLSDQGRWDEAIVRAAEAAAIEDTEFVFGTTLSTIPIHAHRGQLAHAREVLTRHAGMAESDNVEFAGGYAIVEATVLVAEGKPREGLAAAERALELSRDLPPTYWHVRNGLVAALEAAAACADSGKLRELLATLDGFAPGELGRYLAAQRARFRAHAEPRQTHLFGEAEEFLEELQRPFELAVVRLEHAERLLAVADAAAAEPLLTAAEETFEALGARPWLERLRAARGRPAAAEMRA